MASTPYIIFVLCLTFIPFALAEDCDSYIDSSYRRHDSEDCSFMQHCCGTCENRYCCSSNYKRLYQETCSTWDSGHGDIVTITSGIAGLIIFVILIISCCVCPCCCLYKMCRKPTPVIATTTTTVVQQAYPQPPSAAQAYQGAQYPGYHPVPVQPGYGGQPMPMPTAPYQGQISGPPPPYQEAGPGYPPTQAPYSQAGYSAGHPAYPMQPPAQPGCPPQPDYSSNQPAYNPAYMEPPKTGY